MTRINNGKKDKTQPEKVKEEKMKEMLQVTDCEFKRIQWKHRGGSERH